MNCNSCGNALVNIEYQARSADEAHRIITKCINCPIDAQKISVSTKLCKSRAIFRKLVPMTANITHTNYTYKGSLVYYTFDNIDLREFKDMIPLYRTSEQIYNASRHIEETVWKNSHNIVSDHMIVRETNALTSNCTKVICDSYLLTTSHSSSVIDGGYRMVDIPGTMSYVYRHIYEKDVRISLIVFPYDTSLTDVDIIQEVHISGFYPSRISNILNITMTSNIMNLMTRAWDVNISDVINFVATVKVDGERMFLWIDGCIAYVTRRGSIDEIRSWIPLTRFYTKETVACIDTEFCYSTGFFLIDILCDLAGELAPKTRNITWLATTALAHKEILQELNVRLRPYWLLTDSVLPSNVSNIPNDGIVAIHPDDLAARKVKSTRSIELRADEYRDTFITEDGIVPFKDLALPNPVEFNRIYELRITLTSEYGKYILNDVFIRVDKHTANKSDVVANICLLKDSDGVSDDTTKYDENVRRSALMWCNNLTHKINTFVENIQDSKSIIIDVGTGDGQSLDNMSHNNTKISRVFIEPDLDKCVKLARRLRIYSSNPSNRTTQFSVARLRSSAKSLMIRSTKYFVCNISFEDLLKDDTTMNLLKSNIRAIVCTFSIHFLSEFIPSYPVISDLRLIGTAYVYDDVDSDGSLIDEHGVMMKRNTDFTCSVSWGNDDIYTEPFTTTTDYKYYASITVPELASNSEFYNICKHIRVISRNVESKFLNKLSYN
jgi:hypothetical protein